MKPAPEMNFDEFVAWAKGRILIAIGEGKYDDVVWMVCNQAALNKVFGGSKETKKEKQ